MENFSWKPLYTELATKLLDYKDDRPSLVEWIYSDLGKVASVSGQSIVAYLKMKDGAKIQDIDPFSVFGIFNRNAGWEKRTELLQKFKEHFSLQSEVPTDFNGIPTLDARRSFFFSWYDDNEKVIKDQWELYEKVVRKEPIASAFDQVIENGMPKYSLTMALFWIDPDRFVALDSRNRSYLDTYGLPSEFPELRYKQYQELLDSVKAKMDNGDIPCSSFLDFSYMAWKAATTSPRVWMWNGSEKTFELDTLKAGSSAKGKVHFAACGSKEELGNAYREAVGNTDVKIPYAYWNFISNVKVGDIVVVFSTRKQPGNQYHLLYGWGRFTSACADVHTDENPLQRSVQWHLPNLSEPVIETKTKNDLFFHSVEGIEADNIIRLLNITDDAENVQKTESHVSSVTERQYWWLVAKPKIWSLANMKNGEVQDYTLYNDNGNQRRVFQNFLNAKAGDIVIGYEATPTKQIVALLEIAQENDGKNIWFKKTETLGTPIDYSELKADEELKNMEFFVNPNGSLFKMTEEEYGIVMEFVREANPIATPAKKSKYTKTDFLREVFMEGSDYDTLLSLLLRKKNIILQGAPGVGKTFAAKRLAYSILGEVDDDRIEQVQFHQNYSYEDFMMGYKPNEEGGFFMRTGSFYNFCKRAAADSEKPYFFIIDEINRGNLSKIFGELLMLIENDYRDKPIKLSYRDEKFAVPVNVHIIGMMNTADRSLAMIDYALRRRFSFFDMGPGFETQEFKNYMSQFSATKLSKLIDAVIELNQVIADDESLGAGFCIGHSYFCNLPSGDDTILKSIVEYDILPMLREYWFDNVDRFNEEAQKLRSVLA